MSAAFRLDNPFRSKLDVVVSELNACCSLDVSGFEGFSIFHLFRCMRFRVSAKSESIALSSTSFTFISLRILFLDNRVDVQAPSDSRERFTGTKAQLMFILIFTLFSEDNYILVLVSAEISAS